MSQVTHVYGDCGMIRLQSNGSPGLIFPRVQITCLIHEVFALCGSESPLSVQQHRSFTLQIESVIVLHQPPVSSGIHLNNCYPCVSSRCNEQRRKRRCLGGGGGSACTAGTVPVPCSLSCVQMNKQPTPIRFAERFAESILTQTRTDVSLAVLVTSKFVLKRDF